MEDDLIILSMEDDLTRRFSMGIRQAKMCWGLVAFSQVNSAGTIHMHNHCCSQYKVTLLIHMILKNKE
jgi:hypothetical protein